MRMYVVKGHYGIPHEHARTLCLGGSMRVLEGSTVALCVDVDVLNGCSYGLDEGAKPTVQWFHQ